METVPCAHIAKGMVGLSDPYLFDRELAGPMSFLLIDKDKNFFISKTRSKVSCPLLRTFAHLDDFDSIRSTAYKFLIDCQLLGMQLGFAACLAVITKVICLCLEKDASR